METKKVWFVTGASKGLGLELVKELLVQGYKVAATSRNTEELVREAGNFPDALLPLKVDLVNEQSVSAALQQTMATFGKIDVVVNNAGYGQLGTLEELSDQESRQNFDINVFGSLNVIRNVTGQLRKQGKGLVINIASIGGLTGNFPGWGIYCATKFAMAGFTEAYAAEVKEFGIQATVVYPGYFRTNFLSSGSLSTPKQELKEYSEARKVQLLHQENIRGNQAGDPAKAALALIALSKMENAPLHLFLGSDAHSIAGNKLQALGEELSAFKSISLSTDY